MPWYVSIQYEEKHVCDGTLINDQHILTSASCLQSNRIPLLYSVLLGAHYLSNSTNRVLVNRIMYHPDYNLQTLENNIGLIKLKERIQSFSDHIAPACLARSIRQPTGSNLLLVASWDTMENSTSSSTNTDELRQTILLLKDECSRVDKKFNFKKQLCLGTENSNSDSYHGGRGSGLFEKHKYDVDRWILTGISSHRNAYTSRGSHTVYTRVNAYYDWIQKHIN